MPFYDYRCSKCDNEQENFHKMSEEPEVICEKCGDKMVRAFKNGFGGFKMTKDGTRNRDYGTRYGGKKNKSDNATTPSESAQAKAKAQMEDRKAKKKDLTDPYSKFR